MEVYCDDAVNLENHSECKLKHQSYDYNINTINILNKKDSNNNSNNYRQDISYKDTKKQKFKLKEKEKNHNNRNNNCNNNMFVFITILIVNACVAGTIPATPENITVTFLSPTTVRVSWQTMIDLNAHPVEKYIVTYKPSDDRIVQDVAGNSEEIILDRLSPNTQYSIAVTAIWLGKKYRSRQIIFRTLDLPKSSTQQELMALNHGGTAALDKTANVDFNGNSTSDVTSTASNILSEGRQRELPTVRGVEIGIVLMVLMVWAGAIALFFNRWGKIRMLLPYQPDYKHEQLKVPGTGVCSTGVCNGQHSHQFDSSECGVFHTTHNQTNTQPLHSLSSQFHILEKERSISISERCTRSRINSAIFVSSDGKGFDSIEFLRRHGSQSVLCRKARSAENITDNGRKKSFCENNKQEWSVDGSSSERPTINVSDEYAATNNNNSNNFNPKGKVIELRERRTSTVPIYKSNMGQIANVTNALATSVFKGNLAAVTTSTSNIIVGSVSIEAPPAHIKNEELYQMMHNKPESTETIEELVIVPREHAATITTSVQTTRSRRLVHQGHSLSSSSSPPQHNSPKALKLKINKPKLEGLPLVSVSGPTPPAERPPSECL